MDEPNVDSSLQSAVADARAAFAAALDARRPEEAAALYAEDAWLLAPSAEMIEGRGAIETYWRTGLETGIADIRLEPIELERRDGAAYEIGRYSLSVVPSGGRPVVDRGNYLLVHRPQADGKWCWAIQSFNPDSPPAPPIGSTRPSTEADQQPER